MPVSIHALLAECDVYATGLPASHWSFNPRTPCGVRPSAGLTSQGKMSFQSTHSLRSATFYEGAKRFAYIVSIHALLAECDKIMLTYIHQREGFNPRTPCGVRLGLASEISAVRQFQSTHSLRSATESDVAWLQNKIVSIHALLAECDPFDECNLSFFFSFNPRTPCGVRHEKVTLVGQKGMFQSTHSLRSATREDSATFSV